MHGFRSLFNFCYYGYISDEFAESYDLSVCTLEKIAFAVVRQALALENCFDISPNTAHRSAEFVGYVVAHLLFQNATFLCPRYIVQSHFKITAVVNHHLYSIARTARRNIETHHRSCLAGAELAAVESHKLADGTESVVSPNGIDIARRHRKDAIPPSRY